MQRIHVHIPYPKIGEHFSLLTEVRFNLEIYFPSPSLDSLTLGDIKRLKGSLEYGPSLSIHAPFLDLSPGAVDSRVRQTTIDRFNHILDLAEILNPRTIVFHSGYEKWKYALKIEPWLENSLKTWSALNERARAMGVTIAIENIFEDEPQSLSALMQAVKSDNFGICFDTGHCNLFTRVPLQKWLEELMPYIVQLHVHDNDKNSDAHLPIGDGTFDFPSLFSALGSKDYIYTIEAHTPEDVMKSMERLKRLLGPSG